MISSGEYRKRLAGIKAEKTYAFDRPGSTPAP